MGPQCRCPVFTCAQGGRGPPQGQVWALAGASLEGCLFLVCHRQFIFPAAPAAVTWGEVPCLPGKLAGPSLSFSRKPENRKWSTGTVLLFIA